MFSDNIKKNDTRENYKIMIASVKSEIESEKDLIANLANVTSIINIFINDLNWVGFYIMRDDELVVGPFQGMPACTRIKIGRGVCGTAVKEKKTILIDNVHEFPGHIACDSASASEIVIPIVIKNKVIGVLDVDSPTLGRFTELEKEYLTECVELIKKCNW